MTTLLDKPVPETRTVSPEMRVVPYLSVDDGAAALDFYTQAFGAEVLERYEHEGKLGHATLRINGGILIKYYVHHCFVWPLLFRVFLIVTLNL